MEGGKESGIAKEPQRWMKDLGSDGCVHYLHYGEGFMSVHSSKLIKLYTLNMCHIVYFNYTSIKLEKIKRQKQRKKTRLKEYTLND